MKKILFISHEANRSGAPFVLLYLLQWLQKNSTYQVDLLLLRNGALAEEFKKATTNFFLLESVLDDSSFRSRIKKRLHLEHNATDVIERVNKIIQFRSYSVVYGNTIASLSWLLGIREKYQTKTIAAIHELAYSLEAHFPKQYLIENFKKIDVIIAGSQAVADNLVKNFDISSEKISVVHSFIPINNKITEHPTLLSAHKIPGNRFIIGCAGYAEWRKGADLIIPIGLSLQKYYPDFDFHILWIGANFKDMFVTQLLYDIEKTSLTNRITILGNQENYLQYINLFNVFAMISREDPFPLVSLEAAYLQKPIVMFAGTGGTEELLVEGVGKKIPYLNIELLCKAIFEYATNKQERELAGNVLKKEVEEKYNPQVICRKVLNIFNSFPLQ